MNYGIEYVDYIPSVNCSNNFVIRKDAVENFLDNWLDFCDLFLCTFNQNFIGKKFKTVEQYTPGSKLFFHLEVPLQEFLGMKNNEFKVFDVEYLSDQTYQYLAKADYKFFIDFLYTKTKQKFTNKYTISQIIDKFLIYEWDRKHLLFPATFHVEGYIRKKGWNTFIQNNELVDLLEKKLKFSQKDKYNTMSYLITATSWNSVNAVSEESIVNIYDFISKYYQGADSKKKATLKMSRELRYFLIEQGREDILHPQELLIQQKNEYVPDVIELEYDQLFDFISYETYPSLVQTKINAQEFMKYMYEVDGLAIATIKVYVTCFSHFLKYLIRYYPYEELDEELVDIIFDFQNKNYIKNYVESLSVANSTKADIISLTARFLEYLHIYTKKAKKNTPKIKSMQNTKSFRNAMPEDMLKALVEIVKDRPPQRNSYWDPEKADLSWWPHKNVYPVLPIMYLMHLFIPLRGAQIRNLCRDKSFVYDHYGHIQSFVINTDKNVNRKQLQEIPNVWEDLNIFEPFLKWHKEYFPHLKPVVYNRDKNTPWENIIPLMLLHGSNRPMDKGVHASYHKKVLCIYQMELNQKYEKGEIEYLPKVAWLRDGEKNKARKNFFTTYEEIDKVSDEYMKQKIRVAYDIHSIRVTGITRYIDAGFSLHLVSLLSGHTDVNTMIRVYIKLEKKSLEKKLKSSVDKLNSYAKDELSQAYDENDSSKLEQVLKEHKLFSLHRNSTDSKDYELGTMIALTKDPLFYKPMIHGICPAVECPPGRENKCSLCPHLITGEIFAKGVAHQANLAFARFYRESKELEEEKAKNYSNSARVANIEMLVEEIMGWHEIINKVEENCKSKKSLIDERVFTSNQLDSNLAYLENVYDARQLGVEQDQYAMKMLTIKAIQYASKIQYDELNEIISDNEKAIDYLMDTYQEYKNKNLLPEFVNKLK
ncbi:hypothetical protein [Sulfurimonas microaerophilic]|uniref:hypothetical protein n=1 Tax=Sulfurimonas microaerophilic TaxID=3058392 RepID=UPI0027153E47|nr:hypothetical protein [Sulfurimonas sp. hsl 1-7]